MCLSQHSDTPQLPEFVLILLVEHGFGPCNSRCAFYFLGHGQAVAGCSASRIFSWMLPMDCVVAVH